MATYKVKEVKRTFLRKKNDLDKLLKLLTKEQEAAVKVIADIMHDTKDMKEKKDCAEIILRLKISVSESISKDEIQRLIAEVRLDPSNGAKQLEADDMPSRPILDFNTIQEVN